MLGSEDFKSLKTMMEEVVGSGIETLSKTIDCVEKRLDGRIDDLENRMDERIDDLEKHLNERMDVLINDLEKRMEERINNLEERINDLEKLLFEELDRTQTNLERKIENVGRKVSEIEEYYRIRHIEDDNVEILLKLHNDLDKRVTRLEEKVS